MMDMYYSLDNFRALFSPDTWGTVKSSSQLGLEVMDCMYRRKAGSTVRLTQSSLKVLDSPTLHLFLTGYNGFTFVGHTPLFDITKQTC